MMRLYSLAAVLVVLIVAGFVASPYLPVSQAQEPVLSAVEEPTKPSPPDTPVPEQPTAPPPPTEKPPAPDTPVPVQPTAPPQPTTCPEPAEGAAPPMPTAEPTVAPSPTACPEPVEGPTATTSATSIVYPEPVEGPKPTAPPTPTPTVKPTALPTPTSSPTPSPMSQPTGALVSFLPNTPLAWLLLGGSGALITVLSTVVTLSLHNRRERQIRELAGVRRQAELRTLMQADPTAWKRLLDQILADALLDANARVGDAEVLSLGMEPSPHYTVASDAIGIFYLFTTAPKPLRRVKILKRSDRVIPLDATLHPDIGLEMQAVWEHLVTARGQRGVSLPRQLAQQVKWYLAVRVR